MSLQENKNRAILAKSDRERKMFKGKLKHIVERLYYKNVSVTRNLTNHNDICVDQLRAARSLLNWSQAELSKKSGYALATINNIERGQYQAHSATLDNIVQTFEEAGIQFIDGPGVRIDTSDFRIKCYEGVDAFHYLFKKILLALEEGGELYVSGLDERALKEQAADEIKKLQASLNKNVSVHVLNNKSFSAGLTFQNMKKKVVADDVPLTPCFIYQGRVAIVLLQNPVHVAIMYNKDLSQKYLSMFQYIWNKEKGF